MELNTDMSIEQLVSVYNTEAQKRGSNLVRAFRNKEVAIGRIKALVGDEQVDVETAIANAPELPPARASGGNGSSKPRKEKEPQAIPGVRASSIRGKIFSFLNSSPEGKASIDDVATNVFGSADDTAKLRVKHGLPNLDWRKKQQNFKIERSKDEDGKSYLQLKTAPVEQQAADQTVQENTGDAAGS